jgi:hypothetical protein
VESLRQINERRAQHRASTTKAVRPSEEGDGGQVDLADKSIGSRQSRGAIWRDRNGRGTMKESIGSHAMPLVESVDPPPAKVVTEASERSILRMRLSQHQWHQRIVHLDGNAIKRNSSDAICCLGKGCHWKRVKESARSRSSSRGVGSVVGRAVGDKVGAAVKISQERESV